ncbi:hypothetical protein GCM10020256_35790 [Streptomyces thermocoprophilus]
MSDRITVEELSELMRKAAGVTVPPEELEQQYDTTFDVLGIDSLGLLGVVGELEKRYGAALPRTRNAARRPGSSSTWSTALSWRGA